MVVVEFMVEMVENVIVEMVEEVMVEVDINFVK